MTRAIETRPRAATLPSGIQRGTAVVLQILTAGAVSSMVWTHAWVSEDSFITFRYVSNALQGYGAVFNAGEYVQGYTHPLWFLFLLVGTAIQGNSMAVAIAFGVACTAVTVFTAVRAFATLSGSPWEGTALTMLFGMLCLSSGSWIAFQTGGLENALSHLLIVLFLAETAQHDDRRVGRLALLAAALVLTRPDLVLLVAPAMLVIAWRRRHDARSLGVLTVGLLPVPVWIAFAWWYYGDPAPNTAHVKLGIYASWYESTGQGLAYAKDWLLHEPVAVVGALALLCVGLVGMRRRLLLAACGLGIVALSLYVVGIGGGFMRGRMLLAFFVAATFYGLAAAARILRQRQRATLWLAGSLIVVAGGWSLTAFIPPAVAGRISEAGIVDEWSYYPGYHLAAYRRSGRLVNPYMDLTLAARLRAYAAACGPVTLHSRSPGTLGYLAGPDVTIIDTLGLTDRLIARLPRTSLHRRHPRPGHPDKYIPMDYLSSRRDISLLPDWRAAVKRRDCSLPARAASLGGAGEEIAFPDGWGPAVSRLAR